MHIKVRVSRRGTFRRGPTPFGQCRGRGSRGISAERFAARRNRHPPSRLDVPTTLLLHLHAISPISRQRNVSPIPSITYLGVEINLTRPRPLVPHRGRCLFSFVVCCPKSCLYYLKRLQDTCKLYIELKNKFYK